ncbi:MAG: nitroreductase family protein [Actinomycetales bacterium]|nr:nitroreductase family protein [Actinomycetales bacterium]
MRFAECMRYSPPRIPADDGLARGRAFHDLMEGRRSVRMFSDDPVPREIIETAVATANTAPSGAHQQPWTFVATTDPIIKHRIRLAAEEEERENYEGGRLPDAWREAIAPLGTTSDKGFLEVVPWIVVAFAQKSTGMPDGGIRKNYYVNESVGIACGLFIASLHTMGLATLTHTPNPMAFLTEILDRPSTERPYILFPVGYPAVNCEVPDLVRKPLSEALVEVTAQA